MKRRSLEHADLLALRDHLESDNVACGFAIRRQSDISFVNATARKRVIWFAGFPGSGSVKIQTMAARILYGEIPSLAHLDSVIRPMLIDLDMPPDPHGRTVEPIFTHHVPSHALVMRYQPEAIVHVVRHPVDVAFSIAGFMTGLDADYATADGAERAARVRARIDEFLDLGTLPKLVELGYGSTWSIHVRLWMDYAARAGVPVVRFRLEDVRADETEAARALARFFGKSDSGPEIESAVATASLENSRRMEEEEIASRRPGRFYYASLQSAYDAGWRYHGKGQGGYGRGNLTQDQWARAAVTFGRTAHELGYSFP